MGVIIQKQDGGFLYTTTDIACAKYRYEQLGADRILYFIDSRQAQHLQQAWTIVRKAGYVPDRVSLEHHAFGMMLGKDGRPFKTRTGAPSNWWICWMRPLKGLPAWSRRKTGSGSGRTVHDQPGCRHWCGQIR